MTIAALRIPSGVGAHADRVVKNKTAFELKRAGAKTYEELVQVGIDANMHFPEGWAEHVMNQRKYLK